MYTTSSNRFSTNAIISNETKLTTKFVAHIDFWKRKKKETKLSNRKCLLKCFYSYNVFCLEQHVCFTPMTVYLKGRSNGIPLFFICISLHNFIFHLDRDDRYLQHSAVLHRSQPRTLEYFSVATRNIIEKQFNQLVSEICIFQRFLLLLLLLILADVCFFFSIRCKVLLLC